MTDTDIQEFRGRVEISGGMTAERETFKKAIVTMCGDDTFKLAARNPDRPRHWGDRFETVDRLLLGSLTDNGNDTITVKGISEKLTTVVGVKAEDATVVWTVTLKGCQTCG